MDSNKLNKFRFRPQKSFSFHCVSGNRQNVGVEEMSLEESDDEDNDISDYFYVEELSEEESNDEDSDISYYLSSDNDNDETNDDLMSELDLSVAGISIFEQ